MDTTVYKKLVESCKDAPEMLDFISDQMRIYLEYVNSVVIESIQMPILRQKYMGEPQILQYEIMDLDKIRRSCHEMAIDACNKLNRISEVQGLPPFYPGDPNDRYAVADFAIDIVRTFYDENRSKNKDLSNDEYITAQVSRIPYQEPKIDEETR